MSQTATEILVDRLLGWGVDTIFGLPGDGINGLIEALRRRKDEASIRPARTPGE
jgi:pyruvate dehydrogenase (quinone)